QFNGLLVARRVLNGVGIVAALQGRVFYFRDCLSAFCLLFAVLFCSLGDGPACGHVAGSVVRIADYPALDYGSHVACFAACAFDMIAAELIGLGNFFGRGRAPLGKRTLYFEQLPVSGCSKWMKPGAS